MDFVKQFLLPVAVVFGMGYLVGSFNFSIIITRLVKHEDIRTYGSGNAGATNVMRAAGALPAAATFILDFLKCIIAVVIGYYFFLYNPFIGDRAMTYPVLGKYAAGVGCMLGHLFPLYFQFRGGKGVTTAAALICLLDWRVFIPVFLVFLAVMFVKRIVSLSSIIGISTYPVFTFLITWIFDYVNSPLYEGGTASLPAILLLTLGAAIIAAIVVLKHKENIKRLKHGEEKPMTFKRIN